MSQPNDSTAYEQQLVALGRVLQTLREESNVDVLVQSTVDYIQTGFNYSLVWVGLYDRVAHQMQGQGGFGPEAKTKISFFKQRLALSPGDILEQVVIQQRPLGIADLREESRAGEWREIAQQYQVQGTMVFPLRHRDRCFGVVLLGSRFWGVSPHAGEKARLSMLFGALAEALHQAELELARLQAKRPERSLLNLLTRLRNSHQLTSRLEAVVAETQAFIQPDRTNIYWFEREHRYFWRRVSGKDAPLTTSHQRANVATTSLPAEGQVAAGITVQEVNSFYKALVADHIVMIEDAESTLKADMVMVLMQRIRARSLIAAPISFNNELLGFLAVESDAARMWTEEDKQYVQGAAQMAAIATPLSEMEEAIDQIRLDQGLMAEISRAICDDSDWRVTLKTCADQLCQRLGTERFLVLLYDPDRHDYDISYQAHSHQRQQVRTNLPILNDVDRQMLAKSMGPVAIENWDEDLKLLAWRDALLKLGVRSLLVCNTSLGQASDGLIIVAHDTPRSWTRTERDLVKVVAQQIGVILNQWQMQRQLKQQQQLQQNIQWGVNALQRIQTLPELDKAAIDHILQALHAQLGLLVTWDLGATAAQIGTLVVRNKAFQIDSEASIVLETDALINWALQTEGILPLMAGDLPSETHAWLNAKGIGTLLVTALRTTAEHTPQAVLIVADGLQRVWTDDHIDTFSLLTAQLSWSRRHLLLTAHLQTQRQSLRQLNWYKHQVLDEIYQSVMVSLHRLNELAPQLAKPDQATIALTRYQQVLRQLNTVMNAVGAPLKQEEWSIELNYETIPLASLLKRMLERSDGIIHQRQLWTQVHNDLNISLVGDVLKTEMILHELMQEACERSRPGGRIDVWCRALDQRWLEVSITDNGALDADLIADLQAGPGQDLLKASSLDRLPGLHFHICQQLVEQMGGELSLFHLEDDRILSRLVLPISTGQPKQFNRPSA